VNELTEVAVAATNELIEWSVVGDRAGDLASGQSAAWLVVMENAGQIH